MTAKSGVGDRDATLTFRESESAPSTRCSMTPARSAVVVNANAATRCGPDRDQRPERSGHYQSGGERGISRRFYQSAPRTPDRLYHRAPVPTFGRYELLSRLGRGDGRRLESPLRRKPRDSRNSSRSRFRTVRSRRRGIPAGFRRAQLVSTLNRPTSSGPRFRHPGRKRSRRGVRQVLYHHRSPLTPTPPLVECLPQTPALFIAREVAKALAFCTRAARIRQQSSPRYLASRTSSSRPRGASDSPTSGLRVSRHSTAAGVFKGGIAASPEQIRSNRWDHVPDLFSLGCGSVRILTGRLFCGQTTDEIASNPRISVRFGRENSAPPSRPSSDVTRGISEDRLGDTRSEDATHSPAGSMSETESKSSSPSEAHPEASVAAGISTDFLRRCVTKKAPQRESQRASQRDSVSMSLEGSARRTERYLGGSTLVILATAWILRPSLSRTSVSKPTALQTPQPLVSPVIAKAVATKKPTKQARKPESAADVSHADRNHAETPAAIATVLPVERDPAHLEVFADPWCGSGSTSSPATETRQKLPNSSASPHSIRFRNPRLALDIGESSTFCQVAPRRSSSMPETSRCRR